MTYPLGGRPAIHVNYCPSAAVGWLVISEEMTHWLAGHSLKKLLHGVASFCTAQDLCGRIESLPEVPHWHCREIKVGSYKTKEPLMLYWQDGLEVVEYIFGNPTFASSMDFSPY